jgi:hypothetical protein
MSFRLAVASLVIVLLGSAATPANAAPTNTPWTRVTLTAGWVVDRMLVHPVAGPITNPSGCPLNTAYVMRETDPGRRTFYDMLLAAVVWQRQVTLVVDGCFEGFPRAISVAIR